jgi:hypothetical protein
MKKSHVIYVLLFAVVLVALAFFIESTNDHIECEHKIVEEFAEDGSLKVSTEHICKEQFSF